MADRVRHSVSALPSISCLSCENEIGSVDQYPSACQEGKRPGPRVMMVVPFRVMVSLPAPASLLEWPSTHMFVSVQSGNPVSVSVNRLFLVTWLIFPVVEEWEKSDVMDLI